MGERVVGKKTKARSWKIESENCELSGAWQKGGLFKVGSGKGETNDQWNETSVKEITGVQGWGGQTSN